MSSISKVIRNGCDESEDKQKEKCRKASYHRKAGRENGIGCLSLIVGIAEERRLHTESQNGEEQSSVCIHVRVHTIIARSFGHVVCVERNKQIVEKTPNDARESVDGRILY